MNNMVQAGLGLAMGAEMINNMKKMTSSNESSAPPASSTPSTGLICKNCSQPLAANMKFCSNCGEKVELATSTGANKFC